MENLFKDKFFFKSERKKMFYLIYLAYFKYVHINTYIELLLSIEIVTS